MKNTREFQKLFKVNFPVDKHHQYYIDTLMKSPHYAGLQKVVRDFEQFEQDVEKEGLFDGVKSYKLDYALPKMKNYLLQTDAYDKLQSRDFGNAKLRTKDDLKKNEDTFLISIDFKAANYNSLKTYDSDGELYNSWEELCENLNIHPTLAGSKSFRQYCFGNTNPKRLQKTQHINTLIIIDKLIENHGFEEDDFVFISHDEFIVRLKPDHKLAVNRIHILNSAVGTIIQQEDINMPTHFKVFSNKCFGKGMFIQTLYQVKMGGLSKKYDTLFKVPGSKFFKYFKKHIIKEPLEKRDLMFMNDGEIALWAEKEDSIVEVITPEGEITMDEVLSDYRYVYDKIKENVPGVNDSQIRKMIYTFMSICPYCHEADRGCQCWNDE